MGENAFIFCVAAMAVVVLLSATPFPDAFIGFLFGITVAFFVAPVVFIVAPVFRSQGLPVTEKQLVYVLVALYGLATLAIFLKAWRAWRRDGHAGGPAVWFAGHLVCCRVALMGLLSSQALVKAWHWRLLVLAP